MHEYKTLIQLKPLTTLNNFNFQLKATIKFKTVNTDRHKIPRVYQSGNEKRQKQKVKQKNE